MSSSKGTQTIGEHGSKNTSWEENPTGQTLADLIQKERDILAKEVRWLQDKA